MQGFTYARDFPDGRCIITYQIDRRRKRLRQWILDAIFMKGNEEIDLASLEGRDSSAGLDLSSTGDITVLVLMFPPRAEDEKYILLLFFWVPEETTPQRVKAASVPYDIWERQ